MRRWPKEEVLGYKVPCAQVHIHLGAQRWYHGCPTQIQIACEDLLTPAVLKGDSSRKLDDLE